MFCQSMLVVVRVRVNTSIMSMVTFKFVGWHLYYQTLFQRIRIAAVCLMNTIPLTGLQYTDDPVISASVFGGTIFFFLVEPSS